MADMAISPNSTEIPIKNLQIGEKVLAIDHNDQIVSTEIISFLHYENNSQGKFKRKDLFFTKLSLFQLFFIYSQLKQVINYPSHPIILSLLEIEHIFKHVLLILNNTISILLEETVV